MSATDQIPTFNLKAVLRETGLKADTLRAWERRYGLPQPQRSAGGHRLYSQRDIEITKWLIARQGQGMRISQAVDLWRSLEAAGRDLLQEAEFPVPEALSEGDTIAGLRQAWVSACLAYDERGAEQALAQAFALYPVEVVCLELLQKGLAEMGEGWYRGEITVQQEHFASELAMRRLEALLAATPPPTRLDRILVGCPPEEEHTFGPLLLTLLLRRRGWDVLYLGASVPVARLETTITQTEPQLAILPAQQLHTAATLLEMARLLQQYHTMLAFGGLVFNLLPALRSRIPGYFLGESLDLAPRMVEQVLLSPPPPPPVQAASGAYQQALAHYRQQQALIEAQVWQTMGPVGIGRGHLAIANVHLARNIAAALALGDMGFLGSDIKWVEGLLCNYRLPGDLLHRYLSAYYQAAKTHLTERGAPVVTWLAQLIETGLSDGD